MEEIEPASPNYQCLHRSAIKHWCQVPKRAGEFVDGQLPAVIYARKDRISRGCFRSGKSCPNRKWSFSVPERFSISHKAGIIGEGEKIFHATSDADAENKVSFLTAAGCLIEANFAISARTKLGIALSGDGRSLEKPRASPFRPGSPFRGASSSVARN
jgi:hypothetical protein